MRALIPAVVACTLASAVHAQDYDLRRSNLPRSEAEHIDRVLRASDTHRYYGDAEIAADEVIFAPVVITDGTLRVAGTLRDELIALNAQVVFEPGAVVESNVTVVAGSITGQQDARIVGEVTEYSEGFKLVDSAERWHGQRDRWDHEWRWRGNGGADFTVRVADNYNRVEGLPIQFGPDIRTGGPFSTRLQALAVWRTDVGPLNQSQHMGYLARIEQFLGGETFRVGASLHSLIQPIEAWSMTDLEASLSTALLHEDQRDYFEREGWSVYARITPPRSPLELRVEYRDEEHGSVGVRSPWTLFNDDHVWRNQPLVGEGELRLVRSSLAWDNRRGSEFWTHGWVANAEVTHAIDGTLRIASADGDGLEDMAADFNAGLLDLRHYARAGLGGVLAMRAVAGGSLEQRALPPQYQHALGGAGSLPGFSLFSQDCGARNEYVVRGSGAGDVFYSAYGCDRVALVQVEYRGGFEFSFGPGRHHENRDHSWKRWTVDSDFNWTVFFDAGRGWALEQHRYPGRVDTPALYDVGAGIILGGIGLYAAVPLDDSDRGLRFFARLGPRF